MAPEKTDEFFMKKAIAITEASIADGQSPFGTIIVKDGKVIAKGHNEVASSLDITAHGEIVAIRRACKKLKSIKLEGCTLYTNCEPCPMCFSAIHWAGISRVVFGASISDAQSLGFSELTIPARAMKRTGHSPVEVRGGILKKECAATMKKWLDILNRVVY